MSIATVAAPPRPLARSLFVTALFYGGMACIAGVLGNKLVALGPFSALGPLLGLEPLGIEAGIFAFLLLVVLASATAELHGAATANRMVRWGFLPLVVSMALIELVLWLPPAQAMDGARLAAFNAILGQRARLMLAGLVSYGISQTLNVTVFGALKGREGARLLWLRAAVASALSQVVDTLLFITISFWGVFPIGGLLIGQMIAKVTLSILLVPALVYLFIALGRRLDAEP